MECDRRGGLWDKRRETDTSEHLPGEKFQHKYRQMIRYTTTFDVFVLNLLKILKANHPNIIEHKNCIMQE